MKLQAFVTAVLLIAVCGLQAEPTPVAGSLSVSPDKTPGSSTTDLATIDDSKDSSHAASVMREHLARDEPVSLPQNPKGANPQPGKVSQGQVTQGRPEVADAGFAGTLKDLVRPIHEGVTQSGFMEAVRNFESDLGLSKRPDSADPSSARGYTAGTPGTGAPARTAEQIRRDQIASSIMLEEFINEVKPWAFGLLGLLVLGYLVKLWLTYVQLKATRPGRRRRSARRSRSRTE